MSEAYDSAFKAFTQHISADDIDFSLVHPTHHAPASRLWDRSTSLDSRDIFALALQETWKLQWNTQDNERYQQMEIAHGKDTQLYQQLEFQRSLYVVGKMAEFLEGVGKRPPSEITDFLERKSTAPGPERF